MVNEIFIAVDEMAYRRDSEPHLINEHICMYIKIYNIH